MGGVVPTPLRTSSTIRGLQRRWRTSRSRNAIITCQFSRASASAIAAISSAATGRRGSAISAACRVFSTAQASGGGVKLGPRQIHLQELVGEQEPAALVAVEQMMPAGEPEIPHRLLLAQRDQIDRPRPAPPRLRPRGTRRRASASARRADAGCGTLRAPRRPRSCDARRSACRPDDRRARPRTRPPLRPRRARPRDRARRSCSTSCCASVFDGSGAVGLARLDDLHQRRPAERLDAEEARRGTPRAPCPASFARSASQNTKAPDTAHSPGSAARSNTNVSDGSSRMVRNSFTSRGPRALRDRARTARRASGISAAAARPRPCRCGAPADRRSRRYRGARPCSVGSRCRYSFATGAKPCSCQASSATIRWRAKLSTSRPQPNRRSLPPPARRPAAAGPARPPPSRRCGSWRRTPASRAARPLSRLAGQPSRPPPTSPPLTKIASGQSIAIGFSGGAWTSNASTSATMPA